MVLFDLPLRIGRPFFTSLTDKLAFFSPLAGVGLLPSPRHVIALASHTDRSVSKVLSPSSLAEDASRHADAKTEASPQRKIFILLWGFFFDAPGRFLSGKSVNGRLTKVLYNGFGAILIPLCQLLAEDWLTSPPVLIASESSTFRIHFFWCVVRGRPALRRVPDQLNFASLHFIFYCAGR